MKRIVSKVMFYCMTAYLLVPELVLAAGGGGEGMLIVVADTRRVQSAYTIFFLDLYNTWPLGFGILCVVITAGLGGGLGLFTDFLMKRTGLDLTSRKIVEH